MDRGSRLGVATAARISVLDREGAEADQRDLVSLFQRISDAVDNRIESATCRGLR